MWCKLTSIIAHVFAYTSWMALALIALSRALALPDTDVWKRICDNGGSKRIIILTWIFNLLVLLPSFLEVRISIRIISEIVYDKYCLTPNWVVQIKFYIPISDIVDLWI